MRVLHITNWYPNREEPFEAMFIKEHFDALHPYLEQNLLHVEIKADQKHFFKFDFEKLSANENRYQIKTNIQTWTIIELLHFLLLLIVSIRHKFWKYHLVNFHIAYPALRFVRFWKIFLKRRIVITEHWTAYYFNFNMPVQSDKINPIKNIFRYQIPVIAVSKALINDIRGFSGAEFPSFVVPNVINRSIFYPNSENKICTNAIRFFMCNYWRPIKSPMVLLTAVHQLITKYDNLVLHVGGYGPMWQEMEEYVKDNELEGKMILLGKLSKTKVAEQMRQADAFIHAATYETFSVVCAEAISCGTPVIVTEIPAIAEFINETNGLFVRSNMLNDWIAAIEAFISGKHHLNRKLVEQSAHFASKEQVGKVYYQALTTIYVNSETAF